MRLGVRAQAHFVALGELTHALDIPVEGIEVDHEGRRRNVLDGHPNLGRNVQPNDEIRRFHCLIHDVTREACIGGLYQTRGTIGSR